MPIGERLPDPSVGRFVERVEAHDVRQVADAARDLAHRAEVVLEHVVLHVVAVDVSPGAKSRPAKNSVHMMPLAGRREFADQLIVG